ncbi:nucleotidyl transferase AbiEii/AbiGii toxin family protein [Patescibacteria group bacterium]|nr:nucleotidyl transferase AbiEii/AbiGii toxin family protein [Patescibacteria group bacterium]MBU4000145.1 nucleotidyl transferase AbiEii/AbiGii toxin family protein [Patescibacteria group bacterium]MBU4057243.1 nucleotidyl transferase AbiEii/AbiGii toxin family protein [Patescibacteria group bacterium]MBU4368902.1 nucleotidyl transferase AbiEii/AbiGii toxin family protein [Patescibacteria group bacterium]
MHSEILSKEQVELLPLLKMANKNFGLVGGTAVALQIGHRRSIDFDLFSHKEFKNNNIKKQVMRVADITKTLVSKSGEFTFFSNKVKVTFYNYPYEIEYKKKFNEVIKIPDLLTLAAMKAFALGQRAKWKDYADLYFIMKDYFTFEEISKKGSKIFGPEFNEKLFRIQLSYFDDVNYDEKIDFLPGFEAGEEKIKKSLIEFSLS